MHQLIYDQLKTMFGFDCDLLSLIFHNQNKTLHYYFNLELIVLLYLNLIRCVSVLVLKFFILLDIQVDFNKTTNKESYNFLEQTFLCSGWMIMRLFRIHNYNAVELYLKLVENFVELNNQADKGAKTK